MNLRNGFGGTGRQDSHSCGSKRTPIRRYRLGQGTIPHIAPQSEGGASLRGSAPFSPSPGRAQHQTGVDAAEAEGVLDQVARGGVATAGGHDVEVACWVPVGQVRSAGEVPSL